MKVLVTGGAGFIGSHVVDLLLDEGYEVSVIDNLSTGKNLNDCKLYRKNICDPLDDIFLKEKPDYVVHLAAQINLRRSIENPKDDALINILGSLNVIETCMRSNVKKVVFASSAAVYDLRAKVPTDEDQAKDLISPYGIAKLTIERYLYFFNDQKGLRYTALRFANVYGPRQRTDCEGGVIARFSDWLCHKAPSKIFGDGTQTRDFIYVKDIASAILFALSKDIIGSYNIGTGKETSIIDLFNMIKKISGSELEPVFSDAMPGDAKQSCFDISKISKKGWYPEYELKDGLKETIEWIKK